MNESIITLFAHAEHSPCIKQHKHKMRNDKVNTIPLARMLEVKTGISSRAIYSRDWQL